MTNGERLAEGLHNRGATSTVSMVTPVEIPVPSKDQVMSDFEKIATSVDEDPEDISPT